MTKGLRAPGNTICWHSDLDSIALKVTGHVDPTTMRKNQESGLMSVSLAFGLLLMTFTGPGGATARRPVEAAMSAAGLGE